MHEFLTGAEVIARAAINSGCTFFAGYPITPATPILQHRIAELPKAGGVGIQAEDEIASIGMCIGAAMAGRQAMTATTRLGNLERPMDICATVAVNGAGFVTSSLA